MPDKPMTTNLSRINARLAELPADKKGAIVVSVDWASGVPVPRFDAAARVGAHLKLGVEAEKVHAARPAGAVYAAWTW